MTSQTRKATCMEGIGESRGDTDSQRSFTGDLTDGEAERDRESGMQRLPKVTS